MACLGEGLERKVERTELHRVQRHEVWLEDHVPAAQWMTTPSLVAIVHVFTTVHSARYTSGSINLVGNDRLCHK
jgi:hypothetical protein